MENLTSIKNLGKFWRTSIGRTLSNRLQNSVDEEIFRLNLRPSVYDWMVESEGA